MKVNRIDGADLKGMFRTGASWLYQQKDAVDALNVFPVPDGDTGSNMYMTFAAAVREADKVAGASITKVAQAAALGALMGARGNSGVILSQFFRGLAKGLEGLDTAGPSDIAKACSEAAATAVKAVMRPVEGTILTVGREAARGAMAASRSTEDCIDVMTALVEEGNRALARTPDMLPALKEAGVVDAGGKGLMVSLEGALSFLVKRDQPLAETPPVITPAVQTAVAPRALPGRETRTGITESAYIEFRYCTEFLIKGESMDADGIRNDLDSKGDSLLVAGTPEIVKVHIHTNNPGTVLEYAVGIGRLSEVHINNMEEQNIEAAALADHKTIFFEDSDAVSGIPVPAPDKEMGVVAVALGDGIAEVFRSLGADVVVEGGQTMNPSIEEIKQAVEATGARKVFILPNNGNVILTAQQVSQLTDTEVFVVPTKTIPQGVSALLAFVPDSGDPEGTLGSMKEAIGTIRTGEVTFAVRSTKFNGLDIKEGGFISLLEGDIVLTGTDLMQAALDLVNMMVSDDSSLVTIYYGSDIDSDTAQVLSEAVQGTHPGVDVEVQNGGQPLYFYIISVE